MPAFRLGLENNCCINGVKCIHLIAEQRPVCPKLINVKNIYIFKLEVHFETRGLGAECSYIALYILILY